MNFLLSWVHWSLALLLYLHHAKWSQAAPMAEGGQKPHEVMKFMDVYQRSFCRPIETLVDIFQEYPDEIEFIFKPSCVPLMRCGGCCNDESLECVPTEEFNITMQVGTGRELGWGRGWALRLWLQVFPSPFLGSS
ncbi:vascular endothelial growth factor A isoform X3 [Oryx dammah]|nr:vascular endothelial growth factor A isoform X3 [Oryx dammah]